MDKIQAHGKHSKQQKTRAWPLEDYEAREQAEDPGETIPAAAAAAVEMPEAARGAEVLDTKPFLARRIRGRHCRGLFC